MSVGSTSENKARETGGNLDEQTELLRAQLESLEVLREIRELMQLLTLQMGAVTGITDYDGELGG